MRFRINGLSKSARVDSFKNMLTEKIYDYKHFASILLLICVFSMCGYIHIEKILLNCYINIYNTYNYSNGVH